MAMDYDMTVGAVSQALVRAKAVTLSSACACGKCPTCELRVAMEVIDSLAGHPSERGE